MASARASFFVCVYVYYIYINIVLSLFGLKHPAGTFFKDVVVPSALDVFGLDGYLLGVGGHELMPPVM